MFQLKFILSADNYNNAETTQFLDDHLHPGLITGRTTTVFKGKELTEVESQQQWASNFRSHLPRIKRQRLGYICTASGRYYLQNMVGIVCQNYIWPEFFRSFPKGKILVVKLNDEWLNEVWLSQIAHAESINFSENNPFFSNPQSMSGLQADIFPTNVLFVACYGFYPLMLCDYTHVYGNLVLIYVPDVLLKHSQMTTGGAYEHILWRLHHVLDDQWTFDGGRGPKSARFSQNIHPLANIEFTSWVIRNINQRMINLVNLSDHIKCEQMAMTFSRAVCDCILSVSTQMPYMSKVFFFSCLDKLANLHVQLEPNGAEIDAWLQLIDKSFLDSELQDFLKQIPSPAGEQLSDIVSFVSDEIDFGKLSPTIIRDFRNTIHGYQLRPEIVQRIYEHSGELNNDITLLATPLVLYYLAKEWA